MADQRYQYTENACGAGHPTITDNINRLTLVEHNNDGTHKYNATGRYAIDVRHYLPSGFVTDGSVDYSTQVQAALDAADAQPGGGKVIVPASITKLKCNVIIPTWVYFEGESPSIYLIPATDAPVITFKRTGHCVRAGVRNFIIDGTATQGTFTSQDGILMQPNATYWTDTITLENITIMNCGKRGLAMIGVSASGGFIQNVYTKQLQIINCTDSGLHQSGMVLEVLHDLMFCCDNGSDTVDAQSNISFALNTSNVRRTTFRNLVTNINLKATGNAVYLAHAIEVAFLACDFEESYCMLKIEGSTTFNITVDGCNFASTNNINKAIWVQDCFGLKIDNNRFSCTATMTTAIDCQTSTTVSRVVGIDIGKTNTFGGAITNRVLLPALYTIATGAVSLDPSRKRIRIDTEAAAATDDLDIIYTADGVTPTAEWDGHTITITAGTDSRTVSVTEAGNISLTATPFALDNSLDTLTLMWNNVSDKWVEVARSDNGA